MSPALRQRLRTPLLVASGFLLAAAALAGSISHAGQIQGVAMAGGAAGLLFFLAGSTRVVPELLNWGLGLILAVLVASVPFSPGPVSPLVLVEGACLYAAGELGWLAADPPWVLAPSTLLLRGAVVLGGLAVGYLALFGLALPAAGGPLVTVFGATAAVVIFFLLRGRRPGARRRPGGR
ncbi:MAG: hypothetical protein J2P43_11425 [Candidatus Dormibacteraeota bacterium]|nr:hypothetical protein [Candidatus Dormibacteraeota bacterium]